MYSDKLVVAIKHKDRVLRESGDTVHIPFGSEYTIHIKNKNSVRALVRIEIDGVDATEGTSLVIPANGSLDVERFIKGGNLNQGNRFKFIERTEAIENGPRGIKADDGLIRVEFEFEQEKVPLKNLQNDWWFERELELQRSRERRDFLKRIDDSYKYYPPAVVGPIWVVGQPSIHDVLLNGGSTSQQKIGSTGQIVNQLSTEPLQAKYSASSGENVITKNASLSDVGITVPGSISDQKFQSTTLFPVDGVKHVIIMKLLGKVEGKTVEKPITVKTKPACVTCGTVNKANSKFCRECGTGLSIL